MIPSTKKLYAVSILAVLIMIMFAQMPTGHSAEFSAQDEALFVLKELVKLDVAKYNVTLVGNSVHYPSHLAGLIEEDVTFTLETEGSELDWACAFINRTLAHCGLFVREGTPLYMQSPSTNVLDNVKDILQRYQKYTKAPDFEGIRDFEGMKHILDTVDVTKNVEKTLGNIKLKVTNNVDYTAFDWSYTINGIDFPIITVDFLEEKFFGFSDIWKFYGLGNTDVNISKEEAIDISLKHLENFSWTVGDIEVTDFTVIEEPLTTKLLATKSREPLTLNPYWRIELLLDKTYPGYVTYISLAIWADTGEVESCIPIGSGGEILPDTDSDVLSVPEIDVAAQSINMYLIAVAVAIIITIISVTVVIKKKLK